jgi:VWFA-related protein
MRNLARVLAAVLALSLIHIHSAPTFSQTAPKTPPAQEEPPIFGEEIDVRVVNVEAVVTDSSGKRVPGLKPGDFRLKVDGKNVPVSFFTEVRQGHAEAAPAEAGAPTAGPAGVSAGEPVGTSYLVFVDDYFSTPIRRNEVLQAIKKDLARLGPGDRMAIVAFDGARLQRLSGWTSSAAQLAAVFDQAAARPAHGLERGTELGSFLRSEDLGDLATKDGDPQNLLTSHITNTGLSGTQRAYANSLMLQIKAEVSGVVSAMRGAGAPSGRKVMLLLSGGWPFSIQSYLEGGDISGLPSHELKDGEDLYRPLTSTANLLGFTIYPVDVPGIESAAADATSFGPAASGVSFRKQENQGSLTFIAQETGGRALLNSARGQVLTAAAEDVRSYYWLGFTPTWGRDDRRHRIEAAVLRPGLKVRSRNSFLDLSRKAEVSMRLESALLFGSLPGSMPMPIRFGKPVKTKAGLEIPVTLGLPVSALTLVEQNGKFRSHLELRVIAADKDGNRSEVPVIPLDLSSGKAPQPGGFVKYETRLTLKGTATHIVLATYDVVSGKIATAEADVPVP